MIEQYMMLGKMTIWLPEKNKTGSSYDQSAKIKILFMIFINTIILC